MRRQRIAIASAALVMVVSLPAGASGKRIKADDFGEAWPFTVSEGVLSCSRGSVVTFTANGARYAVNGTASAAGFADIEPIWKFNWSMYEEIAKALNVTAEEAKAQVGPVRINIGPIIDAGLALC